MRCKGKHFILNYKNKRTYFVLYPTYTIFAKLFKQ